MILSEVVFSYSCDGLKERSSKHQYINENKIVNTIPSSKTFSYKIANLSARNSRALSEKLCRFYLENRELKNHDGDAEDNFD